MKLSSLFRCSLVISNLVLLCIVILLLPGSLTKNNKKFTEITVERINVVNADGTPVMAISNKQRIAGPVVGGKKYPPQAAEGREYMSGIVFFNESGDEMGGLLFNSFRMPNGKIAGLGHLSFDRFDDNQVLSLEYNENKNGVKSGLSFYDRPGDGSFKKSMDLLEEARLSTTSPERLNEINNTLHDLSEKHQPGSQRIFIGSSNESARLELKDRNGKTRGRFLIDDSGEARLEFLDEQGNVKSAFPR